MAKVASIVGARPQFVKLAPIAAALEGRAEHVNIHTGQHYDDLMSDVSSATWASRHPRSTSSVGSGSHGMQTGRMLEGLERELERLRPDWVLVYGDTNSTVAGALAAVKLHLPVAHLEAGLRSSTAGCPRSTTVCSPTTRPTCCSPRPRPRWRISAREGLADRAVLVGDVMTDVLYSVRDRVAAGPCPLRSASLPAAVLRRDDPPAGQHRRPRAAARHHRSPGGSGPPCAPARTSPASIARAHSTGSPRPGLKCASHDPLPYPELVSAVEAKSAGVVTDSGGLQKEAFLLRVPATTLRGRDRVGRDRGPGLERARR